MKILFVTDAWKPQINGVVTTLIQNGKELEKLGWEVDYLTPDDYRFKIPLPTYSEIKLAVDVWRTGKLLIQKKPDFVHIATEGPIGFSARRWCERHNISFTTSYHTKMPEYVHARASFIKPEWVYAVLRWLHRPSKTILVTTESMKKELEEHGFTAPIKVWGRGVDTDIFHPHHRTRDEDDDTRWLIYVGRVSREKNLEAFLSHKIPNTRTVVVGDGPDRKNLEKIFPNVEFVGYKQGEELAWWYANADVFVFPSKTDTFGIVMIEANACGTPIAAYPVTGPIDYVVNNVNGMLHESIDVAILNALNVNRNNCVNHATYNHTWGRCAEIFEATLVKNATFIKIQP